MDKISKNNIENVSGGRREIVHRIEFDFETGKKKQKSYFAIYKDSTGELIYMMPTEFFQPENYEELEAMQGQFEMARVMDEFYNSPDKSHGEKMLHVDGGF